MSNTVEHLVLSGNPTVEVRLKRSARIRRLSLRVSRLDGQVTLTLPSHVRIRDAEEFLDRKADWVRGHLAARPDVSVPEIGGQIMIEGQMRPIAARASGRAVIGAEQVEVRPDKPVPAQVLALLKALARQRLTLACDHYSGLVGRPYTKISLRDTRSRWGSCSSAGNLMFSWRLILAPPEILDYVAAHEVTHLVEMNHSAAFWEEVARICPDYARHRTWLRKNGAQLHAIRFDG